MSIGTNATLKLEDREEVSLLCMYTVASQVRDQLEDRGLDTTHLNETFDVLMKEMGT
jgi:hypothetical protein